MTPSSRLSSSYSAPRTHLRRGSLSPAPGSKLPPVTASTHAVLFRLESNCFVEPSLRGVMCKWGVCHLFCLCVRVDTYRDVKSPLLGNGCRSVEGGVSSGVPQSGVCSHPEQGCPPEGIRPCISQRVVQNKPAVRTRCCGDGSM